MPPRFGALTRLTSAPTVRVCEFQTVRSLQSSAHPRAASRLGNFALTFKNQLERVSQIDLGFRQRFALRDGGADFLDETSVSTFDGRFKNSGQFHDRSIGCRCRLASPWGCPLLPGKFEPANERCASPLREVPQGRSRIAQRFIAGLTFRSGASPVRDERARVCRFRFLSPLRALSNAYRQPTAEAAGHFRSFLVGLNRASHRPPRPRTRCRSTILDCGGKSDATPLFLGTFLRSKTSLAIRKWRRVRLAAAVQAVSALGSYCPNVHSIVKNPLSPLQAQQFPS